MKRLHMWKPELKKVSVRISKTRKEDLQYLQLPESLGLQELKEDVKAGAIQYRNLIKYAEGESQTFTIIRAYGLEEGLAAVAYLDSCYREKEKNNGKEQPADELLEDGFWRIRKDRIPVFGLQSQEDEWESLNGFGVDLDLSKKEEKEPETVISLHEQTCYESVCFVSGYECVFDYNFLEAKNTIKTYHQKNRHVYFVSMKERERLGRSAAEIDADDGDNQEAYCSMMLDFDAELCRVEHDKLSLMKYYHLILASALHDMGYRIDKTVDTDAILRQVDSICFKGENGFAETLRRVLRYAWTMKMGQGPMGQADFAFLKSFTDVLKEKRDLMASRKSAKALNEDLVGMEEVKAQIRRYVNIMKYNKLRKEKGEKATDFHNTFLFLGAPGTAKTTAAHLMGAIMKEEHLLPDSRFIAVNGAELKGAFVGHTAPKVHKLFANHDIILIDEAYALTCTDGYGMDSYSKEAISQLIIEMEEHGKDKLIIFAGYGGNRVDKKDNKMKQFLESNPGIRSRINGTILFESYTTDQLMDIFRAMSEKQQISVPAHSLPELRAYFEEIRSMPNFGNGREARKVLEQITLQAAIRMSEMNVKQLTKKEITEYTAEDVTGAINQLKESAKQQMGVSGFRSGFYQERKNA